MLNLKSLKTSVLSLAFFSSVIFSAQAQTTPTIDFVTPRENIGGSFLLSNTLTKFLQEKGWNVNFKALGNCALAKEQFKTSDKPFMMMWENTFIAENKEDACHSETPKIDELVSPIAFSPFYVCVRKDSSITEQTFLTSKNNYAVAVYDDVLIPAIANKLKSKINNNLRLIYYKNTRAAFLSGEVDIYIGAHGAALMKENQATCWYNTGNTELNGTKPIGPAIGDINFFKELHYFTVAKNLNEQQMTKLRNDIKEIMKTEEWKKISSRYIQPNFDDLSKFNNMLKTYTN